MDPHRDALADPLGGADQLEREVELAGVRDVLEGDLVDAGVVDVLPAHPRAEGEHREQRHLGCCVAAVTSSVGSASANPACWASASASA